MRFTKRPELSMKIMSVPGCPGGVIPEDGYDHAQLEIIKEMFKYRCGIVLTFPGDPNVEADVVNAQFMLGRYVYELIQIYGENNQVYVMGGEGKGVEPIGPESYKDFTVEDADTAGLYIEFYTVDGEKVVTPEKSEPGDLTSEKFVDADDKDFVVDPDQMLLVAKGSGGSEDIVNPLKYNVVIYLKSALDTVPLH